MKKQDPTGRRRRLRGVYILPNLFTSGNLFCGFFATVATFSGRFLQASIAILAAGVFDVLDGKIARLAGANSRFGIEFDSLADLVSFGLAPALLVFSWALKPYGRVGWLAAFLFLACGALRLARFNVQAVSLESKFFTGLPIPAAACMIALTVLLHHRLGFPDKPAQVSILLMIYFLAFLMVSNLRYFSIKGLDLFRRKPFRTLVVLILCLIIVVAEPEVTLFSIFAIYVLSGPAGLLALVWKRRIARKVSVEKTPGIQ
ncbi:MAG: CDP-diacylglycerol--serine O-phosphatidyltransferase [Deltaproteobacteria bacterium]|nr:CDP-diacylglycerol--serine O-phosphatidyltransferase [Deltaproteobacteria bacterium]MBW2120306.1 CDP-diacylglycerol--serine O-phosphatidyltransferase [Deltaproteobacteria bacterium]